MELYSTIHVDDLEKIYKDGYLNVNPGAREHFYLTIYPTWAITDYIIDKKLEAEDTSDLIIISIDSDNLNEKYLFPKRKNEKRVFCYEYINIIQLKYINIGYGDYIVRFVDFINEFMSLKKKHVIISNASEYLNYVQWYILSSEKRNAFLNIMGRIRSHHSKDLALLTGFNEDFIIEMNWRYESSLTFYYEIKEVREIGRVKGLYDSGLSIKKIMEITGLQQKVIEEIIASDTYLPVTH